MKIHIKHNLDSIPKELRKLSDRQIGNATFRATNETARRVRKTFSQEIRKHINLPAGGSSKGGSGRKPPGIKEMIQVRMADRPRRGASLASIFATIATSTKPISLIHFVRGSKEPPRQAGIPAHRRKKPRVSIMKGQTRVLPKMFIQEAKGSVNIFRRHSRPGPDKMLKQAIPGLFKLVENRRIAKGIRNDAGEFYSNRLLHHMRFAAFGKAGKPK